MLLHVLAHIELDQCLIVAEQELGEGLGQFGLTHAGGAQEDERTARTLRVLESGTSTTDGLADRLDGVLLTDDPLVEFVLHAQQAGGLLFGELVDGNTGPQREHLGDGFLIDLIEEIDAGVLHLLLLQFALGEQFLLAITQAPGLLEALGLDGFFLLGDDLGDLVLEFLEVRWGLHALDTKT